MNNALQSHPPLELAIGQLTSAEQSHAQVSLRVLASHLKLPCVVVQKEVGDITLKPCNQQSGKLCVTTAYGEAHIDRPMRLVPLSDALSGLIDGIIVNAGHAEAAARAADTASAHMAPHQVEQSLLGLLLGRTRVGPMEVCFQSGRSLLVDGRYAVVHLSAPAAEMLPGLQHETITSVIAMDADDFAAQTGKGSTLFPLSVEQLCWSLEAGADTAPVLDRWHEDDQARIALETWPNLSTQPDQLAWLSVLAGLSRGGMSMAALRQAAIAAGISPGRARYGLSLLFAYRHARVVATGNRHEDVVVQMPVRTADAPKGLLGRIRSRLRALAA